MEWVVGLIVVVVAFCLWGLNVWLNQSPPPSQFNCRTCRKLQREIQWLKLGLVGMATVAVAVPFAVAVGRLP